MTKGYSQSFSNVEFMRASFIQGLKGPCLCALLRWGDGASSLCSLCQSTKLYKNTSRAGSWTLKRPLHAELRHCWRIYAVRAFLWVTEKQIPWNIWVKNLPSRRLLCSAVPEVNFRASKSYDSANQVTEGICGKSRHLVLLTSCLVHP